MAALKKHLNERETAAKAALQILDDLRADRDLIAFRDSLGKWASQPPFESFGGVNGQMFINQLVKYAPDPVALAELLAKSLVVPASNDEARDRLTELLIYVDSIKKAGHPAPKRVPYVCSFFWSLRDHDHWPCMWTSAEEMLRELGWFVPGTSGNHASNYLQFKDIVMSLDDHPADVEHPLFWLRSHRFVGLDPSLVDRSQRALELYNSRPAPKGMTYESDADRTDAEAIARSLVAEMKLLGSALQERMTATLGRSVEVISPKLLFTNDGPYRSDTWVSWRVPGGDPGLSIQVWANHEGVAVGLHPGWFREGWYDESSKAIEGTVSEEAEFIAIKHHEQSRIQRSGREPAPGEWLLGRWFDKESALDRPDFDEQVLATAAQLKPALERLIQVAGGGPSTSSKKSTDPLGKAVERFLLERSYPTEKDESHKAERASMARSLTQDELDVAGPQVLRRVRTGSYGRPGPQSIFNATLRDATPYELEEMARKVSDLLWGSGEDAGRIDFLLEPDNAVRGLGESMIMKLLAIAKPDRYLPVFPYTGDMGKARMMKLLEVLLPADPLSRGHKQVEANDALRARLENHFPGDAWGMAQFLYWLNRQGEVETIAETDILGTLADELMLDKAFLEDVVALLREKGQIIFYGPPGTGKTYIAMKLAEALAPDASRRQIVQFHPSTSYEDFFEGYRPETTEGGSISYRLTPGPLVELAELAQNAPGLEHVMVLDEINRANIPKVFGELLFLLEYRGQRIRTLYRSEDAFELPPDLLFIGTMNTADRSIALIDAALRRRFHFISLYPDQEPMEGLLRRWLAANGGPDWVADLVDAVNADLIQDLGGPHLQIGPSHFMKNGLDESKVRKIWAYNIYPFVEDQLFGRPDRHAHYEFDSVLRRLRREIQTDSSVPDDLDADEPATS